jgi:hypothetical protein
MRRRKRSRQVNVCVVLRVQKVYQKFSCHFLALSQLISLLIENLITPWEEIFTPLLKITPHISEMEPEEPEDEYDDEKYDENGNEEMRIRANDVDDQVS